VPGAASGGPPSLPEEGLDLDRALAELERDLIEQALRRAGGVRKEAAAILHVSVRSLRYRLEKLGIEVGGGGSPDSDS
jgi:two-component system response regulator PilR (NtrC family)